MGHIYSELYQIKQYKSKRMYTYVFIDYAEAFNKLYREELFELLGELDLIGKDNRIIQN